MHPIYREISEPQPKTTAIGRPKGLCVMKRDAFELIFGATEIGAIDRLIDLIAAPPSSGSILGDPDILRRIEVLITGWGGPILDEAFLDAAPKLKAVFHGAGAVGRMATAAIWDRQIIVSSAYAANAVPVAEYTLAAILFSLKHGWRLVRTIRDNNQFCPPRDLPGCYGSTVGLVSMGMVARTLLKHLALCDLHVQAYDPFLDQAEAARLGIELVSLDRLFRESDVVSVHTPLLAETVGLITGEHLASMKSGATFINTSRGRIVREEEMLDVLQRRPDLQAVLDVCVEEPPRADSRLMSLPNIVLTPHMAGSVGAECRRMGQFIVAELERYVAGKPLHGLVTGAVAAQSSHRPERPRRQPQPIAAV